ncbi:L,D-transpeptidase [Priestia abyssalis]|uniref:L,D-transpeptidase n=1 Tax=Priestia abyssalis TaxID=1221450 RepID=UPI0009957A85|nr:L,D-transpeptidase [Priestia abyssalis]
MNVIFSLLLLSVFSPIWPLGTNPVLGDPFIIINKENNKAVFINEGKIQSEFHISTGKEPELTPEGKFTVVVKAKNPYYRRKDIQGGDPENPLGTRWIGFDARETDGRIYGLHGTNNERSIGKYVTEGCVRFHSEAIEWLYDQVPLGTRVLVVKTTKSFEELARQEGAISTEILSP